MKSAGARLDKLLRFFGGGPAYALATEDLWCIKPGVSPAMLANAGDRRAEYMGESGDGEHKHYRMLDGGIAEVAITGVLTKEVSFMRLLGWSCKPTLGELACAVLAAAEDENARGLMLFIDTPGGQIPIELVDAVREAVAVKPVHAYVSGCGCSAGYWPAAQAHRLTANRGADLGGIGVFSILRDASKAAGLMGLKFHLVASGPYKGAGVEPGVGITPVQLEYFQERNDDSAALFIADVATGRGMSLAAAEALADGRCWIASRAVANGLCDGVETYQEALAALAAAIESGAMPERALVPPPTEEPADEPPAEPEEEAMAKETPAKPAAESAGPSEEKAATGLLAKIIELVSPAKEAPAQAAAPAGITAEEVDARIAAAVQAQLQAAEVDRDLAALEGKVPPAVLKNAETRGLLLDAKAKGAQRYKAALGLVAQQDASSLLGGLIASDEQTEDAPAGLGVNAREQAALRALGMEPEAIRAIEAKYELRKVN
jgi:signal peptide peptidase SppA